MSDVLIIKTGSTLTPIAARRGDFETWFNAGLGAVSTRVVDVANGAALPAPDTVSAAVVTGSPAMVSHRLPWSEMTAAWLGEAIAQQLPVLGVCYGHQLLAHALGGRVGPNPHGRQIGTVAVECAAAASSDPLFAHLPSRFKAQTSHLEAVLELPAGAVRLASAPKDVNHAFRLGEYAWGVQFHPEFDANITLGYIQGRAADIAAEGGNPRQLAQQVETTPLAAKLLGRFARLALRPALA